MAGQGEGLAAVMAQLAAEAELRGLAGRGDDPTAYIAAARRAKQAGRLRQTLRILEQGLERCSPDHDLYSYAVERLEKCNRTEEAIAVAGRAMQLFPDSGYFRVREALLLPVLYASAEELGRYRRRFAEGLERLPEDFVEGNVNKYLAYQGENDRELQGQYGQWAHAVLAKAYPQWVVGRLMPPVEPGGRIRVGYVSARFRDCSVTKAFGGWLRGHDPSRFAVYGYHVGRREDAATERVRAACCEFRNVPGGLAEAVEAIVGDKLHVLVYLDVGMETLPTQLAGLRLAPVQCAAWDHPVTTGLPTIDYFLTAEANEGEGAEGHYTERLVRLPGIGICVEQPERPAGELKRRADWGLAEDGVVYLSCQTVFKYLPGQDAIFARIARGVPGARFVFLVTNELVAEDFGARLGRAFAAEGLDWAAYCRLLPEVSREDYWSLLECADVVLDTMGWSGAVSTFDAVAAGRAVVTMPGEQMRSRQSAAFLGQMGVTETVAVDACGYVEIAVRLGLDAEWRERIVAQMRAGTGALLGDGRSIGALERFYRAVVSDVPWADHHSA